MQMATDYRWQASLLQRVIASTFGTARLVDPLKVEGYRYYAFLKWIVINVVCVGVLVNMWLRGWVMEIHQGDSTHMVIGISLVFLYGLYLAGRLILEMAVCLNQVSDHKKGAYAPLVHRWLDDMDGADSTARTTLAGALKLRLESGMSGIKHLANSLVFLGLLGTVIGFIMALSGVDASTAGDIEAVGPMVTTLIDGMSVALYTTLVGALLNIWLMMNYHVLAGSTGKFFNAMVYLAEQQAKKGS